MSEQMQSQPNPELEKNFLTWEQYEQDMSLSMMRFKESRGLSRRQPLTQERRVTLNSQEYRFQLHETGYGHLLRIVDEYAPKLEDNQYTSSDLQNIDTSFFTERPELGVNELVLKFHRGPTINGKKLKPVMQLLKNPSARLFEMKRNIEKARLEDLLNDKGELELEKGQVEQTVIHSSQIFKAIESTKSGIALEHWHPSHNVNFAERAWDIAQRILKA